MIKNVVFDIGNVLVNFRWKEYLADKGFDAAMIKRIAKASVETEFWDEFDRGAWSEEKTITEFIKQDPGIENELHIAYDNINGMLTRREKTIPWLRSLKEAGYGVYYLSNYSQKAYEECSETLDFIPYMDGGILSFRELVVKPNPEIYNRLLTRYNLTASECVFIDDSPKNITAAKQLGWSGIVFESYEQVVSELEALGVIANRDWMSLFI